MLLVLVLAGPAAAWDQFGGNAANTGAIDSGPAWPDVAFEVQLPGSLQSTPVIDADAVYVATSRSTEPGLGSAALFRVDLATGRADLLYEDEQGRPLRIAGPVGLMASPDSTTLEAYDVRSGELLWTSPGIGGPGARDIDLQNVVHEDGRLYVAFAADPGEPPPDPRLGSLARPRIYGLACLDASDGRLLWEAPGADRSLNLTGLANIQVLAGQGIAMLYAAVQRSAAWPAPDVAADPGLVQTTARDLNYRLLAFDRETGAFLWELTDAVPPAVGAQNVRALPGTRAFSGGAPLLTTTFAFVRTDRFLALNLATGARIWESDAGLADPNPVRGTLTAGWNDGILLGTTAQTLYRLDATTGEPLWQHTEADPVFAYSISTIGVSPTTAYVSTIRDDGSRVRGIDAYAVDDGELLWRFESQDTAGLLLNQPMRQGYGNGIAVFGQNDGKLIVLGRTPASLVAPALDATAYPAPGENVRVDLGAAGAGSHGPPTRYRADWGDGNVTSWQPSPLFEHAYEVPGVRTARFEAANDANQTASAMVTYRVGEPEPNVLSVAFAPENQERTFFVLGLLITGVGGLIGVLAVRRRRGRLAREIAAVDALAEAHRADAASHEMALRERRVRARGLVMDGKLDEAQGAILERHIDDLARRVRLREVDHGLDFLPQRIARQLREALQDGRLSGIEHAHVARLIQDDPVLTPELKARTRAALDRWRAQDGDPSGQDGSNA